MNYEIDIYKTNEDNSLRYCLGINSKQPFIVVGLNPSTACDKEADKTILKIMGFAERAGKDGFIMLNLYPQRTTYPVELDTKFNIVYHQNNLEHIKSILSNFHDITVWLCYGDNIRIRPYLRKCLKDILSLFEKYNTQWVKTSDLTKKGNPRHPLYIPYDAGLSELDIINIVSKL